MGDLVSVRVFRREIKIFIDMPRSLMPRSLWVKNLTAVTRVNFASCTFVYSFTF